MDQFNRLSRQVIVPAGHETTSNNAKVALSAKKKTSGSSQCVATPTLVHRPVVPPDMNVILGQPRPFYSGHNCSQWGTNNGQSRWKAIAYYRGCHQPILLQIRCPAARCDVVLPTMPIQKAMDHLRTHYGTEQRHIDTVPWNSEGTPLTLWSRVAWCDAYQGERQYIDPVFFIDDIKQCGGKDPLLDWAHKISLVAILYKQFACLEMYGGSPMNIAEMCPQRIYPRTQDIM